MALLYSFATVDNMYHFARNRYIFYELGGLSFMGDIRRLQLDITENSEIKACPVDVYAMNDAQLENLIKTANWLLGQPYWGPEYQAWEPFFMSYLRTGTNAKFTLEWAPRFNEKLSFLLPAQTDQSRIFKDIIKFYRTATIDVFQDTSYLELQQFAEWSRCFTDNYKVITKIINSEINVKNELRALLSGVDSDGLSRYYSEAVYLYRHNNIMPISQLSSEKAIILEQTDVYVSRFNKAFDTVLTYLSSNTQGYDFYCEDVRKILVNALRTSTEFSTRGSVFPPKSAYSFSIKLAEQLTSYVSRMPCVHDIPKTKEIVFDAMVAASSQDSKIGDGKSFYLYTVTPSEVDRVLDKLREFYADMQKDRIPAILISRADAKFAGDSVDMAEYLTSLRYQGFPV